MVLVDLIGSATKLQNQSKVFRAALHIGGGNMQKSCVLVNTVVPATHALWDGLAAVTEENSFKVCWCLWQNIFIGKKKKIM